MMNVTEMQGLGEHLGLYFSLGAYLYASEGFPKDVSETNICFLIVLVFFCYFLCHPVQ